MENLLAVQVIQNVNILKKNHQIFTLIVQFVGKGKLSPDAAGRESFMPVTNIRNVKILTGRHRLGKNVRDAKVY